MKKPLITITMTGAMMPASNLFVQPMPHMGVITIVDAVLMPN